MLFRSGLKAVCVGLLSMACAAGVNASTSDAATAAVGMDLLQVPALQSPKAARALLLGVHSAGARLIAVGERGIVVFSDDGGATWTQGQVPVSVTLTSVFLVSDKLGWAAGHDGVVLRTTESRGRCSKRVMTGTSTGYFAPLPGLCWPMALPGICSAPTTADKAGGRLRGRRRRPSSAD